MKPKHYIALLLTIAVGWGVLGASADQRGDKESTRPRDRHLGEYVNSDGRAPNGLDDGVDDSEALRMALADGPGVVHVGPGHFRCGEINIPAQVTLSGSGPGTTIRPVDGKNIIVQRKVDEWVLRDLVLDGEAEGDWHDRQDNGHSGIVVDDCREFNLVGITVRNFNGAGIQLKQTVIADHGGYPNSLSNLDRITATGNYFGVRFDYRAEYINATELSCQFNVTGCVIHCGNVKIAASNFGSNVDAMLIQDTYNGSHGSISNCLFNHNERYAVHGNHVTNGMVIDGCAFFGGAIRLEDCVGVMVHSGLIGCTIDTTASPKANRVADNFMHANVFDDPSFTFDFSPATIVEGNFANDGPWKRNRRVAALDAQQNLPAKARSQEDGVSKASRAERQLPNGDRVSNSIQTLPAKDVLKSHATDGAGVFLKSRVISTISAVVVRQDDTAGAKYQEALGYTFLMNTPAFPGLTQMDDGKLVLTLNVLASDDLDGPRRGVVLFSKDDGMSWTQPHPIPLSRCNPVNLGGSKLMIRGDESLSFSDDGGETWSDPEPLAPLPDGRSMLTDVPMNPLVEDGKVRFIFYTRGGDGDWGAESLQRSFDIERHDWGEPTFFPKWPDDGPRWRTSEGSITRAKNGDLVAAFRTGRPGLSVANYNATSGHPGQVPSDHWRGICTSHSTDDGKNWSEPDVHFQYGHVHMSLLPLTDGRILMTYAARIGELEGRTYHGIEAVMSHDNGKTWDWERRYILYRGRSGPMHSPQSVLLSDGRILTTFMYHTDFSNQATNRLRINHTSAAIWSASTE